MSQTRFFNKTSIVHNKPQLAKEHHFINVGGGQFNAVAVALIDHLKNVPRAPEVAVKKILERFFIHFPDYKLNQAYFTPLERLSLLINGARRSEIIKCMAYVLHQLTVDELLSNPLRYRTTFDGFSAELLKDSLRDANTVLPVSALAALAHTLGLTIILSFKEPGKELRRREIYKEDLSSAFKFEINLQVQGANYFPGVKNHLEFLSIGSVMKPVEYKPSPESLADIIDLIADQNKNLLFSYEQSRRTLLSMVSAGELNKKMLLDFYIRYLPLAQSNNGVGSVAFFSRLEQLEKKAMVAESLQSSEQHLINLLVGSLAGWISTRQIDADQLFDSIEPEPLNRSSSAAPAA